MCPTHIWESAARQGSGLINPFLMETEEGQLDPV